MNSVWTAKNSVRIILYMLTITNMENVQNFEVIYHTNLILWDSVLVEVTTQIMMIMLMG
jgi:hypothetical protein